METARGEERRVVALPAGVVVVVVVSTIMPPSSFVQTNHDAATNADDDASNWMHLIKNRRDREKIARLRDADDPSLRAMFDAITTTLKQKDENVERAAAIGF